MVHSDSNHQVAYFTVEIKLLIDEIEVNSSFWGETHHLQALYIESSRPIIIKTPHCVNKSHSLLLIESFKFENTV